MHGMQTGNIILKPCRTYFSAGKNPRPMCKYRAWHRVGRGFCSRHPAFLQKNRQSGRLGGPPALPYKKYEEKKNAEVIPVFRVQEKVYRPFVIKR